MPGIELTPELGLVALLVAAWTFLAFVLGMIFAMTYDRRNRK